MERVGRGSRIVVTHGGWALDKARPRLGSWTAGEAGSPPGSCARWDAYPPGEFLGRAEALEECGWERDAAKEKRRRRQPRRSARMKSGRERRV